MYRRGRSQIRLGRSTRGVCGDHMGARSLVRKIMRTGYFWPTMQQDAADFVKKCDSSQRYRSVQRVPGEKMTTISSPWPFAQWGIDIMGPLLQGKRQMKFLLIAINYFKSGSKRKPLQQSQKQRYKILYGKILFAGSGYPGRSYQITIVSSTTRDSDHFARAWA